MIKRTLYFGNPSYLSLRNAQLVLRLPEVSNNDTLPDTFKKAVERTIPIEDIGVVVLDHSQITITQGLLEALLENNCAISLAIKVVCLWDSYYPFVGTRHKTNGSETNLMLRYL